MGAPRLPANCRRRRRLGSCRCRCRCRCRELSVSLSSLAQQWHPLAATKPALYSALRLPARLTCEQPLCGPLIGISGAISSACRPYCFPSGDIILAAQQVSRLASGQRRRRLANASQTTTSKTSLWPELHVSGCRRRRCLSAT